MTAIRYTKTQAHLEGHVPVDDAEEFHAWLLKHPKGRVALAKCESMHMAVLQALLAHAPALKDLPADPWLRRALRPLTDEGGSA